MYFAIGAVGGAKKEGFIKCFINYLHLIHDVGHMLPEVIFYIFKLRLLRATFAADRSLRGT